jgi:hypothetical protein
LNQRTYSFFRNLSIVLAIFVFGSSHACAQLKLLYIEPVQTDPAIKKVHSPHIALYDPQAASRHRLFLFIGGTGSKATNSLSMDSIFTSWGYHAISIDYENDILAIANAHSLDPMAFDHYRDAIVTGAPVSDRVKVDPANSILNRFQKLLAYLAEHDPNGGWSEFVTNGVPVWNRIVVAGHSQGSGHAAYIGKMFAVDRVLMFSGPQDYMDDLDNPAPWQAKNSATPPSRFFAFLSENDPFDVHHQLANNMMLMHLPNPETLAVKPGEVIQGNYQILINDFPKKTAHGSTLSTQFTNVWEYMVTASDK